jgi:uncharacterized membrane protein YozB (DUF420 family)
MPWELVSIVLVIAIGAMLISARIHVFPRSMALRDGVNAERAARLATIVNVGSPLLLVAALIFVRGEPMVGAEILAFVAIVDLAYYVWVELNNV